MALNRFKLTSRTLLFLTLSGVSLAIFSPQIWASSQNETEKKSSQEETLYPADLLSITETDSFSKFVFVVDKSQRKLSIYERNGKQIKKVNEFPADIGKLGGNKTKRDDHKTPEGIYFLQKRLTQPEIPFNLYGDLAFTTDYPNLFDQRAAKTGSGIWLHAIPDSVPLTRGSRGCVVVRNDVIKQIAEYIKLGETPILIFDKVEYVSQIEHEKRREEISQYLQSWTQAWESMDVDQYMSFYDDKFRAPGFNYASWKNHKLGLKNKYKYIKVHLYQPYILLNRDQLIVKALQRYESDLFTDYGVKTIYALRQKSGWKIIREEWTPSTDRLAQNAKPASDQN